MVGELAASLEQTEQAAEMLSINGGWRCLQISGTASAFSSLGFLWVRWEGLDGGGSDLSHIT